jgi:phosphatidylglycerophosphate synthase
VSRRVTIAEVAAAYRPRFANEIRTEWAIAVLYRPVSLVTTPLFAALGASPSAVTLLGCAIALALPFAAAGIAALPWAVVGALGVAFCVLDCVDGDLARVTGRSSRRGAYLDFVVDLVYRAGFYSAIGIAADRVRDASGLTALGEHGGLAAGFASAVAALLARTCRLYADGGGQRAEAAQNPSSRSGDLARAFVSGLDHLLPVAVLILGAVGRLDWALVWLIAYSLADFGDTQARVWKALS